MGTVSAGLQEPIFPSLKALSLIRGMEALGVDADRLLASSGLTAEGLARPSARISLAQLSMLYANALAASPTPDLGLRLGALMSPTDYGPYGYAIMTAETFGAGLDHMSEFLELETPAARLSVEHDVAPGLFAIRCDFALEDKRIQRFTTELYLAMVFFFAKELHGRDFRFAQVQVEYDAPAHRAAYEELFECPCHFGAPRNGAIIPRQKLLEPMLRSNPVTYALMREQCEEAVRWIRSRRQLTFQIAQLIESDARRFSAIPAVARELGVSVRSLRRQLEGEGSSYKRILEQVRLNLAVRLLREQGLGAEEVAWRLGYSKASNFRVAFKRWTGQTIRGFLEQSQKDRPAPALAAIQTKLAPAQVATGP